MVACKEDLYLSLSMGRLGCTPSRDQVSTGRGIIRLYAVFHRTLCVSNKNQGC